MLRGVVISRTVMYNNAIITKTEEIFMKYGFGIDLGGTTVKLAYFAEDGKMIDKWEIPTDKSNDGSNILPDIAASIKQYIAEKGIDTADLLGVGIGVPGAVNSRGFVNKCINLGWGIVDVQGDLETLTGLTVRADNDANVAALGELWMGGGAGCDNMIFATLGTGVGGGIIVDGKTVCGVHGAGGEIGHVTLNKFETEQCGCGKRGCAEQYCSATGIVRIAGRVMALSCRESILRSKENLTCKDIFDAGKAGDALALEVLDHYFDYLGQFIAGICCVTDPEVVVLGGGVSKDGQMLLDGVRPYFDKYIFHASNEIRFALATLGNDAGAYGAFKLVLDAQG